MSGTVRGEIWLLGGSVCTGIALMMMYDGLRIFRWLVRHGSFWTGMEDAVYWLFASFATFELLARPALAKLQGADPAPVRVRAALANGFGKPSPLRRFVRATLMGGVVTLPKGGHFSGGIGALAGCNCLVEIPAGSGPVEPGMEVEVLCFVQ